MHRKCTASKKELYELVTLILKVRDIYDKWM